MSILAVNCPRMNCGLTTVSLLMDVAEIIGSLQKPCRDVPPERLYDQSITFLQSPANELQAEVNAAD